MLWFIWEVVCPLSFLAFLVYFCWVTYTRFMSLTEGTLWERLLAAGSESVTKLWARFVAIVGSILGLVTSAAPFLGDPQLATTIQTYLSPQIVAYCMVGIAIITILARNRTKS